MIIDCGNLHPRIEEPEESKSLIEELAELMKGVDDIDNSDPTEEVVTFAELTKKKEVIKEDDKPKKKKKKKKKDEDGFIPLGADPIVFADRDGNVHEIDLPNSAYIDYYERNREDDDDDSDFVDKIVDPNRASYKKLKKDSNKFKREVAEELTLLYDLLGETDKFSKGLMKKYTEMVGNRKSGGLTKYFVDLATTINSTKQSKLAIIKEISNIKKIVMDLRMKAEAQEAKLRAMEGNAADTDLGLVGSAYLQNIIGAGRKNLTEAITGGEYVSSIGTDSIMNEYPSDDEDYDDTGDEYNDDDRSKDEMLEYAGAHNSLDYDALIAKRLESGDGHSFRRTENGSKYIEYENREVKVKIAYDPEEDDYHFFAEDKDGEIIDDYPLPSSDKEVNPIKFSQDMRHGSDRLGRVYKVVQF